MSDPIVTVVVVTRERFSDTRRSLESLYRNTDEPFQLVYVDGGSPGAVARYLKTEAQARGFRYLRVNRYLSPNEARNLGWGLVDTEYVAFVDNDVRFSPGWLRRLLACAGDTGASVVAPLYCYGEPVHTCVHNAGGIAHFEDHQGVRRFVEKHVAAGQQVSQLGLSLRRRPCENAEYHGVLVRSTLLDRVGPLDEAYLASAEAQVDLCLQARALGSDGVWFEPGASVTWISPPPFALSDIPFFLLRWSTAWSEAGLAHFRDKWQLDADDPFLARRRNWMAMRRRLVTEQWAGLLRPLPDELNVRLRTNTVEALTALTRPWYGPLARAGGVGLVQDIGERVDVLRKSVAAAND